MPSSWKRGSRPLREGEVFPIYYLNRRRYKGSGNRLCLMIRFGWWKIIRIASWVRNLVFLEKFPSHSRYTQGLWNYDRLIWYLLPFPFKRDLLLFAIPYCLLSLHLPSKTRIGRVRLSPQWDRTFTFWSFDEFHSPWVRHCIHQVVLRARSPQPGMLKDFPRQNPAFRVAG